MYQERFIAFIDLLGFGKIVERSADEAGLTEKILEALLSIQPEAIHEDAYASINVELVPPEELEAVKEVAHHFNQAVHALNPVMISYFSDSLVISAPKEDVISSQTILDIVAKLSVRLWNDHSLLLRGGLTLGKLLHKQNGPLFGPAMNRAYLLESEMAKYPRILIDDNCYQAYKGVETFRLFESLFEQDNDLRYVSLGTALRHILTDSSIALAGEPVLSKYRTCLSEAQLKLVSLRGKFTEESIQEKYSWLENDVRLRAAEVQETLYLLAVPGMRESIKTGMAETLSESSKTLPW